MVIIVLSLVKFFSIVDTASINQVLFLLNRNIVVVAIVLTIIIVCIAVCITICFCTCINAKQKNKKNFLEFMENLTKGDSTVSSVVMEGNKIRDQVTIKRNECNNNPNNRRRKKDSNSNYIQTLPPYASPSPPEALNTTKDKKMIRRLNKMNYHS